MRSFITALLCIMAFISCKKTYQPRNIKAVTVKEITIDSISIRAIVAIDSNRVMFAGSNGTYGYYVENKPVILKTLQYNDSLFPGFRSVATNGNDFFILSTSNPALLYKTNLVNYELMYTEVHEKVFYNAMKFFDDQDGIAMGDPIENCLSILLTNDGGNTWKKIPCDQLPEVNKGEAAFAASNTNIKIINNTVWIVTGGTKARVFKSEDRGKTWSVYDTPWFTVMGLRAFILLILLMKRTG